jgi:hypothetical protein
MDKVRAGLRPDIGTNSKGGFSVTTQLLQVKRAFLVTAILATALLTGPLTAGKVSAGLVTCATDPIVALSNGYLLKISANVTDLQSDVQNITYTVNVPSGVTATNITYTGSGWTGKEQVNVSSNNGPGLYSVDTYVSTGNQGVPVTVQAQVNPPNGVQTPPQYATSSGPSGQDIFSYLVYF